MRTRIVAGNWKMHTDVASAEQLLREIVAETARSAPAATLIVCPPYIALNGASAILNGSGVLLGAQNMHYEDDGAYTGEISAAMLKSAGCTHVIVGHSERRQLFGETDETVNKRLHQALRRDLTPIFCIGETLEERDGGKTFDVIRKQLTMGFAAVAPSDALRIVIAYEPVWAIGTGNTATPAQAEEIHAFIRTQVSTIYSDETAENIPVLYGGSVKPENARALFAQPDIDGALVGGASLVAESFVAIARSR